MDNNRKMQALVNSTIRGIIKDVNGRKINREDVVALLKEGGQFILVYYK